MDSGMLKPLQQAAVEALGLGENWFDKLNGHYEKRQEKAIELLRLFGCEIQKPDAGMFLWAGIPTSFENGQIFSEFLLDEFGIFVPPGMVFGSAGDRFVRMSLCSPISIFEECISKVHSKLRRHV